MANFTDTDDFAIPLVRRTTSSAPPADVGAVRPDRMSAVGSGALAGGVGGVLALALIHLTESAAVFAAVNHAADARGVPFDLSMVLAYASAGALGALAGGIFGNVTRYLRKWPALVVWSLVFFVSVAVVFVAAMNVFGAPARADMAGAIIGAAGLYAVVVSLSLPIRRPR